MALQDLTGPTLYPTGWRSDGFTAASVVIDATGEKSVLVCQIPKTGTVDKFAARVTAVTNAPDNGLRFSFQDVVTSTGLPDGVVDQFATVASGSVTVGWLDPGTFDSGRSVTRGDLIALVIDLPTFVAGDSVSIGRITSVGTPTPGFPYGISGTVSRDGNTIPTVALHYDDGTWAYLSGVLALSNISTIGYHSGSTPDEWGVAFQLPVPARIQGAQPATDLTSCNFDMVLYDASDNVLATMSWVAEMSVGGTAPQTLLFSADVDLDANTLYRLTLKPTEATSNVGITTATIPNADILRDCWSGGANVYATSRTNAGAWTDYNNGTDGYLRVPISLMLSGFDDGTGTGAGEVAHVFVG
jgi:hypothetical protein